MVMLFQFMCDCRIFISDIEHTTTAITEEGTMPGPKEGTTTVAAEDSNANSRIDSIPD